MANGEADASRHASARAVLVLRSARPAVAGLLLLIVIAGVGSASPAITGRGPWQHDALAVGIGLEAVLAGLQIALVVLNRRAKTADHPARAVRSALRQVVAIIMVLIVVIAIANFAAHRRGDLLQRLLTQHGGRPKAAPKLRQSLHPVAVDHARYLPYVLVGLIVLAALVVCVTLLVRARTVLRRPAGYADVSPVDEQDDLRQAIESAGAALRAVDDARAAIIASYVAMEGSLASAGAARAVAETPDELLARAVAAGLIRGPAAATLTGLFYEARFSTHPLAATAKDAAKQALSSISAELTTGRAAAAAAQGGT